MIEQIIAYINQKLMQTALFKDVRGLCEIIEKDEQKFPAEYFKGGEFKYIDENTNWEVGLAYHRLTGDIEDEQLDDDYSPTACDIAIRKTYHLRLVCCIPKKVLSNSNDDKYIDTKLVHNLENVLNENKNSILENLLKLNLVQTVVKRADVNRYNVFKTEYQNVKFNIGFEYAYFALEYDVILEGMNKCFENYTCDCGVSETYDFCTLCPQQPAPSCEGCDVTDNLHTPVNIHLDDGDSWVCTPCPAFVDVVITDGLNPLSPISRGSGTTYTCENINTADCNYLRANLTLTQWECVARYDDFSQASILASLVLNVTWLTNVLPYAISVANCQQLNQNLSIVQRQLIQRVYSIKSGQTTSYVANDEGATQRGRCVDWFTLDCPNPFGNTLRFTNSLGGSVMNGSDGSLVDYIIDHSTGLGWYRSLYPATDWTTAMGNINTLNAGAGIYGWHNWSAPNTREAFEICKGENPAGCLNYNPFFLGFASPYSAWTNETTYIGGLDTYAYYFRARIGSGEKQITYTTKITATPFTILCRRHY